MEKLTVVKIGGNVIDHPEQLTGFLKQFAALQGAKILVHGGGKLATQLAEQLGIPSQLVDGRRITDAETLRLVTMVYAGLINKNIVAQLQALQNNAIGLSGADANLIQATKRDHETIDYGFVGELNEESVSAEGLQKLLAQGLTPVFSAITHDGNGQLLNTNADTIASAIAVAMAGYFETTLVYGFEKKGVLTNLNDENSVTKNITAVTYTELKAAGKIHSGMLPKLDNAFAAINQGVKKVIIGDALALHQLENPAGFGTSLTQ